MKPNISKRIFIFVVFCFCLYQNTNQAQATSDIDANYYIKAEVFTLKNGLTFAVVPQKKIPVITHMVWYKTGSNDEPSGKSGLAHFNEHLMFRGSPQIPDGEFSKIIANNGGTDNAFTSRSYTSYHQTIAANRLELVMAMEADRMEALNLTQEVFDTEHNVIMEERLTVYDNAPASLLAERMRLALWNDSQLGIAIIGHINEIKNLTLDDVRNFHQTWYAPNNAYVVIVGDVEIENVKKLAQKYYGRIKPKKMPHRQDFAMPPTGLSVDITFPHPQVLQESLQIYYAVPKEQEDNQNQILALEILSEILGNPNVGRLFNSLVKNQKIASAAGCFYDAMANYPNILGFYGYPRDKNISLETLAKAINDEISLIASGKIDEKELEQAKERMINNMVYLNDSPRRLAMIVGETLVTGRSIDTINHYPQLLQNITLQDIIESAKFLQSNTAKVIGNLIPLEVKQ